ncbi:MAG: DUF5107 domain-containing protein [Saprospiraceae bacterium]|nr:DUF5107 domain-containing protein [Saprospiraceae bacterium]
MHKLFAALLLILLMAYPSLAQVRVWEEPLVLPTYVTKAPDKNPMFFNHQSYQGASRVLYPYKLEDNTTDVKVNKSYRAVYLENEFIKLCVLPEIGGRLFYATDKTNDYEMFYRQHVIKPANIGMLGAWISGGVEFCVFHHHRASTNIPVNYRMTQNEDGSATIWIGEIEPRHRMKWTLGITLHPGRSYVQVDGRLINPTEDVNSILYWANVATHVNEDYQTIFPPSTDFAVFHAKNSFTTWPITNSTFKGEEYYQDSIDASWWKNHPNPVSMFVHDLQEGFLAGYDHGKEAGTMHVANHHIVKGAKLWQWGPGPHGSMWDSEVLTDSDGPYAELMTGAYSDNQPDYSWLKPYETKTFSQYWYPLRGTGGAVSANLEATLNFEMAEDGAYLLAVNTTRHHSQLTIDVLHSNGDKLYSTTTAIDPANPFAIRVPLSVQPHDIRVEIRSGDDLVLEYVPVLKEDVKNLPAEVIPPAAPAEIESQEELYYTGLRIMQFHNARVKPEAYFLEALRRDPLDSRANKMMGIIRKKNFDLETAAAYFRKSLIRPLANYTRPRDAESLFHLGCILQTQGKLEAAYDTLYRAAWDHDQASASYYHLAQISSRHEHWERAIMEGERSLSFNNANLNAKLLMATILRKRGQLDRSRKFLEEVLEADPLSARALYEKDLIAQKEQTVLIELLESNPESYLELALTYLTDGFADMATSILAMASTSTNTALSTYPTLKYYLGYLHDAEGDRETASLYFSAGSSLAADYCFPYRLESIPVYASALQYNPKDARAHYYLGNLLYDKQPARAIDHWEQAMILDPSDARSSRNLGWGYHQHEKAADKAIAAYENAIALDPDDPKLFFELDKIYEKNGTNIKTRLSLLEDNHQTVYGRPDATLQKVKVLLLNSQPDNALTLLQERFFPRQEGVEDLHDIYVDACLVAALQAMAKDEQTIAKKYLDLAKIYPKNHQIAEDPDEDRNIQIRWYLSALKNHRDAHHLEDIIHYQTRDPMLKYYQALALKRLGKDGQALALSKEIEQSAERLLQDEELDFFSIFGEHQSQSFRDAKGLHFQALSHLLHGKSAMAAELLQKSISLNPGDLWASMHLKSLQ